MAPAQASLLAKLDTQERVRDFLTNAVASGRASHAYLFLGAPGAGKLDAAWALAQAFLCEQDGCGACDSCVRVSRHTHPDVHYYTPESATGYLIAQTRELLDDVPLAPIRAKAKVYIIDRAEQLRANTANALLKTLEEPPEGVMFILLGTSADVMLPTIVSRCQCVPFRLVSPAVAAQAVSRATGQDPARCRMAVAVAGSPTRGIEFLKSAERQDARRQMVRAIDSLIAADEADVLSRAKSLIVAVKAPLAEVKSTQEKVLEQNADYLSRGALKQLEDRNKRELNARERSGIMEALASARTLMRDVLLTLQDEAADVVNDYTAEDLTRILGDWGEVETPWKVANCLVKARAAASVTTTAQLVGAVKPCTPKKDEAKFLTKLFQALRIEVNGEMEALKMALEQSLRVLKPGGRLVVISYHSLEDRLVKNFMRSGNFSGQVEKDFFGRSQAPFDLVTRKAVTPSAEELDRNPRSRSAKLRAAVKR